MRKHKRIIFEIGLCSLLLLAGCVQSEIIDDVRLVTGIGYDKGKDDKVIGTILIPFYMPDQKVLNDTLTTSASPTRDLFADFEHMSQDPIVAGSVEVALFGMDIAKTGIYQVLDALQRDPGVGTKVYLAVVDGKAKDILEGDYGKRGNSSFIADLLDQNIKERDLPKTNLHLFMSDFYQVGKSAYLPIIKRKNATSVEISGIALLKDGKVVDKIPRNEMFFFKLMNEKYSGGTVRVVLGKHKAVVESLHTKSKKKLVRRDPYEIDVHIKLKGYLHQYTGHSLEQKTIHEVERAIEKKIRKNSGKLVKQFQEQGVDPFGFGQFVRTKTRNFDYNKWKNQDYKGLTVNIIPTVTIVESGVIE
ncbi:Ger(x)C family spore germination protein [Neobacillus notoginsengisoli]|uniref:Ger(X)C family spore germination protein n=1 Tax=Neobacillus notoginsengisoli TaxID=1578198 RepID=A0A417YSM8_9BACI|nr:Ger(x)C family spore germination protein [Neobacillus notoginsengisoli]RHW39015.1 Ger(x)C family spore germination protein [Neobacillus notoginsengisoli]